MVTAAGQAVYYAAYAYGDAEHSGNGGTVVFHNRFNETVGLATGLWAYDAVYGAHILLSGAWTGASGTGIGYDHPVDTAIISLDRLDQFDQAPYQAIARVDLPGAIDPHASQSAYVFGPASVGLAVSGSWYKGTSLDTGSYFYEWAADGTTVPGATGDRLDKAFATLGTHTLRGISIRSDFTADTATFSVTVVYTLSISGLTSVHKPCNVSYVASVNGGTGPIHYSWTVGGIAAGGDSPQLDVYMNWLGARTIQASATDANGFVATGSKTVTGTTSGVCAQ